MPERNLKLRAIFFVGFLVSLNLALTSYINSSFLETFLDEKRVGLLYVVSSAFCILMLLVVPKVLRKIGEYKFLLTVIALDAIALLLLANVEGPIAISIIFILYFVLNNLVVFSLDELLQIFSKNSNTGKLRGLYLTVVNLAWIMAQVASGRILNESLQFSKLYFIAALVMGLSFMASLFFFKGLPDPVYDKAPIWRSLKRFFRNPHLSRAYQINFLLQFFYSIMVIYTPIYLHNHIGFNWTQIGLIFSIMLLPFVLIQFPIGKYSDKIGERTFLMFGFTIISLATVSLFFLGMREVWIWALVLFSTRVGAAIIEVMGDVYFFKHITDGNDEFIGIYRNSAPLSYIFGPLFALLVLSITPAFNFIFAFLAVILIYGIYIASRIKKNEA